MLSAEAACAVRATLPAVGAALDDITTRFYATMFAGQPELLDGLFNRGNQARGSQRQALAGSIAAFAGALLADPDARPDALLARIAHKHASVGVTEDQYETVHKYLFGAIVDVLGDAVTPEVAAAWDEVYWLMANALIAQEARLYLDAQAAPGNTWRPWTVVDRREETPDTVSFTRCSRPVLALHADRSPLDHALRADTTRPVASSTRSSAPTCGSPTRRPDQPSAGLHGRNWRRPPATGDRPAGGGVSACP